MVPLTVARAFGLPDQPGRSITETLLRSVRDRRLLLVLDNCEHLLEASATLVNDVLAGCSQVTILTTSREPLMVAGEVNWQVPSLSLADEAIDLFTDRARRARPDFTVNDAQLRDGGRNLSSTRRHATGYRTGRRADTLTVARRDRRQPARPVPTPHRRRANGGAAPADPARVGGLVARTAHRTRTNPVPTLGRVHGRLRPRRCPGRCRRHRDGTLPGLDQLSLLVDKSLVVAESASRPNPYRLLETVRQYALEKLGESGEADDVRATAPRPLLVDGSDTRCARDQRPRATTRRRR